jgi:rhodanese-related sulfurtransferase
MPGLISPPEAVSIIEGNTSDNNVVILDVRTPGEFAGGHLEKAINLDVYSPTFKSNLEGLDRNKTYIIYCHTGSRGSAVLRTMTAMGFEKIYNVSGGTIAWQKAGLPLVK